ncbi:hypothetical protein [Salinactinospora qingdaonensis]|uniref:Uncharacterized protein n=1 Tax=Salinactinospora qingdaonensis TaxID=702744 RepID=A0ABP7F056_9ACTN
MLISYREPVGYRRPLHLGWARYGQLWLEYHGSHLWERTRPAVAVVGGATWEVRSLITVNLHAAAMAFDRIRPRPLGDTALLALAAVIGAMALAVAAVLGRALSKWIMAPSEDVILAGGGAIAIGVALLGLGFLVFCSKNRHRDRRAQAEKETYE